MATLVGWFMSKPAAPLEQEAPKHIHFSFRYLDTYSAKFGLGLCDAKYFHELLARLKTLSGLTKKEFIALQSTGKNWRLHMIDWKNDKRLTEKTFGVAIELTADETAWQFMISKNHGRVHGFLIGNTFYIRWLDREHNLYGGSAD